MRVDLVGALSQSGQAQSFSALPPNHSKLGGWVPGVVASKERQRLGERCLSPCRFAMLFASIFPASNASGLPSPISLYSLPFVFTWSYPEAPAKDPRRVDAMPISDIHCTYHIEEGRTMRKARTIVTLSDEEKKWLEKYSDVTGISMAEAIRRGVKGLMDREQSSTYRAALEATCGIWRKGDGLEYQKKLREEWV